MGAISDGTYKLDLTLTKLENEIIEIDQGSKLEIVGDLQEEGKKLFNLKFFIDIFIYRTYNIYT